MADGNRSSDVEVNDDHRDNFGSSSRPPLPQLDLGDDVCQVPLWEREFCCTALNIPWETFCENKRYIELFHQKVMNWDDSEARRNFEDAKERFRAKYFGEPFENPVLDPDMYIDKVDQPYCLPNDIDSNFYLGGSLNNWLQQGVDPDETPSGPGVKLNSGGRMWITGTSGSGGGRILHVGGGSGGGVFGGNSSGRNLSIGGGSGSGGGNAIGRSFNVGGGSVRIWNVGGGSGAIGGNGNAGGHNNQRNQGGGGASGSNGNGGGRSNHRNQGEGQRQQRDHGGIHRNEDEGRRQMRCGCCWPQQRLRMKWRPMWFNKGILPLDLAS